jgi:hypothetical protein
VSGHRLLAPHARNAAVGCILALQVLDLHRLELEAAGFRTALSALEDIVHGSTVRQLEFPSKEPLSGYLRQLAQDLRSALLPFRSDVRKACTAVLDDIDRVLSEAGRVREDHLLSAFADAMRLACATYEAHGQPVPAEVAARISVRFDYQSGPITSHLPIQLAAATYLNDQADGPAAVVDVVLNLELMDELTAFALPYVLLHEGLCHALQGPWQPGRIQADPSSRFAEGWMDVAALLTHNVLEHGGSRDIDTPAVTTVPRWTAQYDAALRVHQARYARHPHDRAWSHRAYGVTAANNLHRLLGRLPETKSHPTAAFLELSLALNTSAFDAQQRDMFVTGIYKRTLRKDDPDLVTELRDYLCSRNLSRFIDDVVKSFT